MGIFSDQLENRINRIGTGTCNVLIIDDRQEQLLVQQEVLDHPAYTIVATSSFDTALTHLNRQGACWHCCVCDIDLGMGKSLLDLYDKTRSMPFLIAISGLENMEIASQVMRRGALAVFDKDPRQHSRLYDEVAVVCALAHILRCFSNENMKQFLLLRDTLVLTPADWAYHASMGERQLERVCKQYTGLTPRQALALFHLIYGWIADPESGDYYKRFPNAAGNIPAIEELARYWMEKFDSFSVPV